MDSNERALSNEQKLKTSLGKLQLWVNKLHRLTANDIADASDLEKIADKLQEHLDTARVAFEDSPISAKYPVTITLYKQTDTIELRVVAETEEGAWWEARRLAKQMTDSGDGTIHAEATWLGPRMEEEDVEDSNDGK